MALTELKLGDKVIFVGPYCIYSSKDYQNLQIGKEYSIVDTVPGAFVLNENGYRIYYSDNSKNFIRKPKHRRSIPWL